MLKAESDVVNIEEYLPFKSVEEIAAFCSNEDGMLSYRRAALQKRIYGACDTSNPTKFTTSICDALFSGNIIGTCKWPFKRYFIYFIIFLAFTVSIKDTR